MKPIVPARIVGGAILAEAAPIATGMANVYRGVDLGSGLEEAVSGPMPGASISGPYRARPRDIPPLAPVPVIVREAIAIAAEELDIVSLFKQAMLARHRMSGSPTPQLLHTLGRGNSLLAVVEEYVCGTSLGDLLRLLRKSGSQMPPAIALAIAQGLVPLWLTAARWDIRVAVDPRSLLLDLHGRIRALPKYGEERARQAVGAAVFSLKELMDAVAYSSPEQLMGLEPDSRSAIFNLGLLLYEMLAGVHPIASAGMQMFEVVSEMAQHDVPHLRAHRSGLHPAVTELVHRCLARDPGRRFASWRELAAALAGLQALFPPTGPAEIEAYLRGSSLRIRSGRRRRSSFPTRGECSPAPAITPCRCPRRDRTTDGRAPPALEPRPCSIPTRSTQAGTRDRCTQ